MAETAPPKPRYGKEVVGKRLKVQSSKDSKWRTGVVKAYHGGYYRHLIEFDDGETLNIHLYSEEYQFLPEPGADPLPDLKVGTTLLSVYWPSQDKWHTGRLVAYDGFMHTIRYDDMDTDFVELQKEKFRVVDPAAATHAKGKNGTSSSKGKAEAAPSSQAPAASSQKHRERQRSVPPPAPPSAKPTSASKGLRPSSAGAGAAADRAAGSQPAAGAGADKSTDRSGRASADRSPSEKQSADRAAVPAAAGHARDAKGTSIDKERRSSSTGAAAAAAASKQAAVAAVAAANAAAGAANKKLPLLNMSHVSKKDREAARMLLGFSSPVGQEGYYAPQPLGVEKSGQAAAVSAGNNGSGTSAGRLAIAAAAAAAAAAAGLPDPTADFYPPSGGNSPVAAAAAEHAAADAADLTAAAAGGGGGSSAADIAPVAGDDVDAGGSAAVAALSSELLAGMQWQMQQLVQQEENRWVEVSRLNTQVTRLQRERDEAVRARDSALVERDVAVAQMRQLQDEKTSLVAQVNNLEREIVNVTSQLSVERGMISNASIDAAQLRVQLTGMRNELAGCKQEATQVMAAIRGVATAGYNAGMATMPNMGYGSTHPGAVGSNAAAAAAAMMGVGPGATGAYGNGAYAMLDGLDPAAAAAVPGGLGVKQNASFSQRMGPAQAAATAGGAGLRGISGEGGRPGGVGQLMQVGPGTLVVGPRRKGLVLDQAAVYTPTAAEAAAAAVPATGTGQAATAHTSHADTAGGSQRPQQQEQPKEQEHEAAGTHPAGSAAAAPAALPSSKPAGGTSSDMNNGDAAAAAAAEAEAANSEQAAAVAATAGPLARKPNILEQQAADAADATGLTTSENALAADDEDSVSEVAPGDQSGLASAADTTGRRAGRPSRKPSSNAAVLENAVKEPNCTSAATGVEAMVGKKRTRSSAADSKAKDPKTPACAAAPTHDQQHQAGASSHLETQEAGSRSAAGGQVAPLTTSEQEAGVDAKQRLPEPAAAAGHPDHDSDLAVNAGDVQQGKAGALRALEVEGSSDVSSVEQSEEQDVPHRQQQHQGKKRQKVAS